MYVLLINLDKMINKVTMILNTQKKVYDLIGISLRVPMSKSAGFTPQK